MATGIRRNLAICLLSLRFCNNAGKRKDSYFLNKFRISRNPKSPQPLI